jgi:predicted enzyme related to lactoylglutathione lyase
MSDKRNPVSWFEIPARDLTRAKDFYEKVFGFEMAVSEIGPLKMAWFPGAEGAEGSGGSLVEAQSYVPSHEGTMVYFYVADIDAVLRNVEKNGGKIIRPKMSIGEYGFVGHFEDCEGNRIALHSDS